MKTVGKCAEIINTNGEMIVSGLHTIPSRPILQFALGYLGYFMNSFAYHDQLLRLMQGTKVSSISKAAFTGYEHILPKCYWRTVKDRHLLPAPRLPHLPPRVRAGQAEEHQKSLPRKNVHIKKGTMAELFDVNVPGISKHLANIYDEGKLTREATLSKMETVQEADSRKSSLK